MFFYRPVAKGCWGCAPPQICQKVQFLPQSGLKIGFYQGVGPKGQLFVTKWAKMGFMRGLGPNGPLSGAPHPPKIESGNGPDFLSSIII